MKKECVICEQKAFVKMFEEAEIDEEYFSSVNEKLRWRIVSEPNKMRMVCSEVCYDELTELLKEYRRDRKESKCARKSCRHKERLHSKGFCEAVKCRCYGFLKSGESDAEYREARSAEQEKVKKDGEILMGIRDAVHARGGSAEEANAAVKKYIKEHGMGEEDESKLT